MTQNASTSFKEGDLKGHAWIFKVQQADDIFYLDAREREIEKWEKVMNKENLQQK